MNNGSGSRWSNLTRALHSRNYRLFFMGQGLSLVGSWMQRTALLWLIGTSYPDARMAAFWLGVVGFAGQIPSVVLTPLAGALADRWDRRRMIIVAQSLAMVQAFVLAGLTLAGVIEMWHIVGLSLWLGAVAAVEIPVRQSFVIDMVDRPEDLTNAIALNSSILNAGRLAGPAIGGVLTALFGVGVCFLFNGFSFLAVIVALLAMRTRERAVEAVRRPVLHNLVEGFRYSYRFAPIRALLVTMGLVSLAGVPYMSLLPVFARHELSSGPQGYGVLVGGVGVGALVGAFYLASRSSVRGLERVIAVTPALLGGGLIVFSLSRSFALSLMLMPLLGISQMLVMASINTVLQTIVDDDKRGRVMSLYSLAFMGMVPLGSLLMGLAARQIGAPLTVAIGGAMCIGAAVYFSRKLPGLRAMVHPIYVGKGIIPEVASGLQAAADQAGYGSGRGEGAAAEAGAQGQVGVSGAG